MPVIFLLGVPRSGTTLLRVMLAGHPALFSPPEMVLAPFATMAERKARLEERFWEKGGLRRAIMELRQVGVDEAKDIEDGLVHLSIPEVYAWLQQQIGDRILVDKCPHLAGETFILPRLASWFPDARYIHLVRHPGSVIRSLQNMPMAEVMLQGYGGDAQAIWREGNIGIRDFLRTIPAAQQVFIRYEDIMANPRPELERLCAGLGVPFHPAVLDPYEGERMREGPKGARAIGDPNMAGRGKLQPELATSWLAGFDASILSEATRTLAAEMGYDLQVLGPPPIRQVTDTMNGLWDTLRRLEASIELPMDLDAVEGRRFLLRMLSASVDTFVEQGDADRPEFHHSEGPTRKMFADCPDADYLRATIRTGPGRVYRVWGRVPPGTVYTGVLLYGRGGRIGNRLTDQQLQVAPDGSFSLTISTEAQPGVWLKADGDEQAVIVRQYFTDRRAQAPVEVHIALQAEVGPPPPLSAEVMADGLRRAQRMLESIYKRTIETYKMASVAALNRFLELGGEQLFPTPDNTYRVCWYRFGADQIMFVRGRLPKARYFSFTLYNVWMESFDYRHRPIVRNHTQIETDADGNFELCLAHRDPGHPNWLDTSGHHAGYLLARALLQEGEFPPFTIQVIYERER